MESRKSLTDFFVTKFCSKLFSFPALFINIWESNKYYQFNLNNLEKEKSYANDSLISNAEYIFTTVSYHLKCWTFLLFAFHNPGFIKHILISEEQRMYHRGIFNNWQFLFMVLFFFILFTFNSDCRPRHSEKRKMSISFDYP